MGFTTRPELRGTFGVVASTHWLASAAAMGALERGGNAFDAAVAGAFVLQVVEPHLNGPAGEAPILLWSAAERRVRVICGQGVAPAAATIASFRALGLDLVPGTGLLAACVPGAMDAWLRLLRDYGTQGLSEVIAPAVHYAEHGFPLVQQIADAITLLKPMFTEEWTSSAAIYLPRGRVPEVGQLFANPKLAQTYRRLLDAALAAGADRQRQIAAAQRAWSQGFVAEAVDRFCRTHEAMDSSGQRHSGFLTGDDMARWQATVEDPITYDYAGWTIAKCGPWTQGPVFLQQLALLKGFDIAAMDPIGPEFVHTVVECAKLAFADREAWYGDPDFVDVPLADLLSEPYNAARRTLVERHASLALRPGSPGGRPPHLYERSATAADALGAGEPTFDRAVGGRARADGRVAGDTCHIDVIDRWGNAISATPSGGWLRSSPVIPELGFPLGTRAQMFWLVEGLPASLAPGKRPRSTLSPALVLKDGTPAMAFGTPGGDQQDQWPVTMFLRHLHHGMNLQQAIDCPSFHTEHMPSSFWPRTMNPGLLALEGRFARETIDELAARGHKVQIGDDWSEGRLSACAVERTPIGMILKAAANPRGMQGYAVGR